MGLGSSIGSKAAKEGKEAVAIGAEAAKTIGKETVVPVAEAFEGGMTNVGQGAAKEFKYAIYALSAAAVIGVGFYIWFNRKGPDPPDVSYITCTIVNLNPALTQSKHAGNHPMCTYSHRHQRKKKEKKNPRHDRTNAPPRP